MSVPQMPPPQMPPSQLFQVYGPAPGVATDWLVLTGIPNDRTGTGRFVSHIVADLEAKGRQDVRILCSPQPHRLDAAAVAAVVGVPNLLLLHPQFLGRAETIAILEGRAAAGRKTHYYILDSSFFCVSSYNHLGQETQPCLRCLGGRLEAARAAGCKVAPVTEPYGFDFVARLRALAATGQVVFLAQNENHGKLARQQFGPAADIQVVGLWCADWNASFDAFGAPAADEPAPFDVVFHGHAAMAKGIAWMVQVAARLPQLRFFLPVPPDVFTGMTLPANMVVANMSWESGLDRLVRTARFVAVPSVWSASIEGALAKSLVAARAVLVVDSPTAFSAELPDGLVTRLSANAADAAVQLARLAETDWRPDPALKAAFVRDFTSFHRAVVERILPRPHPPADTPPARPIAAAPPLVAGTLQTVAQQLGLIRPAYPRRLPGQVRIDGGSLRFADLHGLYFQLQQIFGERLYAYDRVAEAPYILDCGAHVGLASLFFATTHPGCTIDAFEADPAIAAMAADNFKTFGLARGSVHAKAVWIDDQGVTFANSGDDAGHVTCGAGAGHVASASETGVTLPSIRLKDWLARPVDMLKMDIEGGEYAVLADCAESLQNVQRMVVEVHHLSESQGRVGDVLGILAAQGFAYMLTDLHQATWEPGVKPPFAVLKTDKDLVTVLAWRAP